MLGTRWGDEARFHSRRRCFPPRHDLETGAQVPRPVRASVDETEAREPNYLGSPRKDRGSIANPQSSGDYYSWQPTERWSVYGERQNTVTPSGPGVWQSADHRANPV